jgi:hypothetical protein
LDARSGSPVPQPLANIANPVLDNISYCDIIIAIWHI